MNMKPSAITILAAATALLLLGILGDGYVGGAFGLSGEFWRGFLIGAGLAAGLAGFVIALRR